MDWARAHKLKRKTTDALVKEDFNELVVLQAMTAKDIAHLAITQGQARGLKLARAALGNSQFLLARPFQKGMARQILRADEMLTVTLDQGPTKLS